MRSKRRSTELFLGRCSAGALLVLAVSVSPVRACGLGPQFAAGPPAAPATSATARLEWSCMAAPTDTGATRLRGRAGRFGAARAGGTHAGADITLREYGRMCVSSTAGLAPRALEVYAVADGVVAYSRANTAASCPANRPGCDLFSTGLGFTVIIDHGDGIYSLYAHLAQDRASARCLPPAMVEGGALQKVRLGQRVKAGQVIGYLGGAGADLSKYERPSGNALTQEESVQLHFEFSQASAGRQSTSSIGAIVPQSGRGKIDPTGFLSRFYR